MLPAGSLARFEVSILRKDATGNARERLVSQFRSDLAVLAADTDAIDEATLFDAALVDAAGWLKPALPEEQAD